MFKMTLLISIVIFQIFFGCISAEDEYVGQHVGELNSYHHQVSGDVYAVDEHTFLIKNFQYDGNGDDTFFWAGSKPRPGPQGFIVPNENGRTNVLSRYMNKDITLKLPDRKSITDLKWLAIYDLGRQEPFGDVYIPEGFEPPQKVVLNRISSKTDEVQSEAVTIVDAKTIVIENFSFGGIGTDVYFWVGVGPQPHSKGSRIPDEHGYMTPLEKYRKKTIRLELPGDLSVFTVDWLAVYALKEQRILGYVIIPDDLNVPPSLTKIAVHQNSMPNCEQLHKDLQISWEVFGDQVTMELVAQVDENDYIAFGMSGSETEPQMIGGDAVVAFIEGPLGSLIDYNMTSKMPCTEILGQHKGVCEDGKVGGHQDYQGYTSKRENGVNVFTFRRRLVSPDEGDIAYPSEGAAMIIWALGRLDALQRPTMHYAWSKVKQPLEFTRNPSQKNCFAFTRSPRPKVAPWGPFHVADSALREFQARLGPDGSERGYAGITGQPSETGLAWYINGYLTPDLYLKRNVRYRFLVEGGTHPYNPQTYHPLIITDEPHGAYSQLKEEQQKEVRVLAGVGYSVRGESRPTAAGRLCIWQHTNETDRRQDIEFVTFERYRNALKLTCEEGEAANLEFMPNKSWPDIVYYNSWTGANMGWQMHILDQVDTERILEAAKSGSVQSVIRSSLLFISLLMLCVQNFKEIL